VITWEISLIDLLYFMWLLTSWPAEIADMRDSSPARTEPATIVAKSLAFEPGASLFAPLTPSKFKQADCDASWVPPPTVPTWNSYIHNSIRQDKLGIKKDVYKTCASLSLPSYAT